MKSGPPTGTRNTGAARARFRGSARSLAPLWPGARGPRRQSHGPGLHRRPLRRLAVRRPPPRRLRQSTHFDLPRRRPAVDQLLIVTACVRCAPPGNKPTIEERDTCRPYLKQELQLLRQVKAIVCLGGFAWDRALPTLRASGHRLPASRNLATAPEAVLGPYTLLGCYHPSQQNTFTGRLTEAMLDDVFARAGY